MNGFRAHYLFLTFALLFLMVGGCRYKGNLWGKVHNFPDSEWGADVRVDFTPDSAPVADGADRFVLYFRYGENMPFSRVPFAVEIESPFDSTAYYADTLSFEFPHGSPTLTVYETSDTLRLPVKIRPGWSFSISPVVPEESLKDFYSVGMAILENDFLTEDF